MRTKAPAILPIFRSELQARLLAHLFTTGTEIPAAELAQVLESSPASVHRELGRLHDAGVLDRRDVGRAALYRVTEASPLHDPLRELVARTFGVEVELRSLLETTGGVEEALIFGSWAGGHLRPESDIDLLVVGTPDRSQLLGRLSRIERTAGREIDLRLVSGPAWRAGSPFLEAVRAGATIPLVAP